MLAEVCPVSLLAVSRWQCPTCCSGHCSRSTRGCMERPTILRILQRNTILQWRQRWAEGRRHVLIDRSNGKIVIITNKYCYDANFVATSGTAGCRYHNLRYHHWRQKSWHHNDCYWEARVVMRHRNHWRKTLYHDDFLSSVDYCLYCVPWNICVLIYISSSWDGMALSLRKKRLIICNMGNRCVETGKRLPTRCKWCSGNI